MVLNKLVIAVVLSTESFGLIGLQLPEKYKENFDVSSEGNSRRRAFGHRIDTGPEVSLRRYFVRNFTSADVKIRHHMTPSWSAHGSFS
jgi:hypothetical protein